MDQCLIFDADDTLWENNIYFERAIKEFLDLMVPFASDPQQVRSVLDGIEKIRIPRHGYGTRNFVGGLCDTFRHFYLGNDGVAVLHAIERIGDRLRNHPMELLPGVAATLEALRPHYRLLLFTKGDRREQRDKLLRSGLKDHFQRVEIVPEKDTAAYQELIRCHGLRRESAFMVGNSPRSDVRPAIEAGLWAVYIPHPHTWEFEDEAVEPHPRLLVAKSVEHLPALLACWQEKGSLNHEPGNR